MKMQPDKFDVQAIAASGPGWVAVATQQGGQRFEKSVVVGSRGELFEWGTSDAASLTPEDFAKIASYKPELVIFGSGRALQFVKPAQQRALIQAQIGLECMDTAAACRTYNILAQEGRHVLAALILP